MEVENVEENMEMDSNNVFASPACLIVLDMDHLIEEILFHISQKPEELLKYRPVSHKWNDIIVRKISRDKKSFQVKLRYGPRIPRFIVKSDAQRWAGEILDTAVNILTSTTVSRFHYDSVLVDRDFYLVGVMAQWKRFLQAFGKSILHLKIDIKREKFPGPYVNYIKDCEIVVNTECLYAAFCAVPNLESLDFCVRFAHYGSPPFYQLNNINLKFPKLCRYRMLPKLQKLTKITIVAPHQETYPVNFIKSIFLMAPNVSDLYINSSSNPDTFITTLKELRPRLKNVVTLGISHVDNMYGTRIKFCVSKFCLSKLEIDNVYLLDRNDTISGWIEILISSVHLTLVTLILGNRKRERAGPGRNSNVKFLSEPLSFRHVMGSLKVFEVNLSKFKLHSISAYPTRFPVLENLTFTNYEIKDNFWVFDRLKHLLPGNTGRSVTVKTVSLLGPVISEVETNPIMTGFRTTFPAADYFLVD